MKELLCVFLGSGLGGLCRVIATKAVNRLVGQSPWLVRVAGQDFPAGTLVVNLCGCFIIGLVYGLIDKGTPLSPGMRALLTAGFCGGLTTFSTFSHENYLLFQGNHSASLVLYCLISIAGGFACAWAGHLCAR